jgi:drug/metabolite transporter (DMT)-like permease
MPNRSVPATPGRERWAGTIFAFLSTTFYAVSNTTIRYLTDYQLDHDWLLFYKELIGVLLLTPWLLLRFWQGRFDYISKRLILYVILAGIVCQLIGAHLQVLGYAVIGLIISVPLIQSSTLLGVAVLGYYVFGDPLSRRRKMAIAILITAVILLSIGKEMTAHPTAAGATPTNMGVFLLAAAGAVGAGISYSVYVIMLRQIIRKYWRDDNSAWLSFQLTHWAGSDIPKRTDLSKTRHPYAPFPVTLMMWIVLAVGLVIFGGFLYLKRGVAGFYDVPVIAWYLIPVSALGNMVGFFFQIQGLRMTSAVQASLIAVSQMLLLSLIGFIGFGESINMLVLIGLGLTVYGVFMSAKPEK